MAFTPGATTTYVTPGTSGSQNSIPLPLPSHSAGDLLIAVIGTNNQSADTFVPTGWSSPGASVFTDGSSARVFYRVADGSEGATQTFTMNGFFIISAVCHAIAGVDSTTPIDEYATNTNLGSNDTLALSVTGDAGDRRIIAASYNICGTGATISGFTKRGDAIGNSSTRTETALWTENSDLASSGATGTVACGNGAFTFWCAFTLTLNPAAGGGGTNVDVPAALLTDDVFPSASLSATAIVTPTNLLTDDVFPSATVTANAGVIPTALATDDVFPAVSISGTAGISAPSLVTDDIFPASTVTGQTNLTAPVLLTDDEFPSATVTTGVTVTPDPLVTLDLFPQVSIATESDAPVLLTDDVFPSASISATGNITPSVLVTSDAFPPVVITSSAGISAPVLETDDSFPSVSIAATAEISAPALATDDEFPSPSVSTPGQVVPTVLVTTDVFPSASFSTTSTTIPPVLVTDDLFPGASVDDGTGGDTSSAGRSGIVWINEPWTDWPTEEEALLPS